MINGQTYILGITSDYLIVQVLANVSGTLLTSPPPTSTPSSSPITPAGLELISVAGLPFGDREYSNLRFIIPVDPMGWADLYQTGTRAPNQAHMDALLTVDQHGELVFWAPEDQPSPSSSRPDSRLKAREEVDPMPKPSPTFWKPTGSVRTGRTGLRIVACSSTKKSVLGTHRHLRLILPRLTFMDSGTPRRGRGIDDLGFEGERVCEWVGV